MTAPAEPEEIDDAEEIVLSAESIEYVEEQPVRPPAEFVYFRKPLAVQMSWVCFVGGLAALAFAALGFAVALIARVDQFALQFMVTGPTLVGFALIGTSRVMARTPTQVTVGPEGLCIDHPHKPREKIAWADIAWATVGAAGLMQQRQLILYDRNGKALATLGDSFEDFKQLIKQVQLAVARKADTASETVRLKKSRRSAMVIAAVSVFLAFIAGANFWMAVESERTAALFDREAVEGDAEIVRRFVAPNGTTKRLEYRVTGEAGKTGTRNAEVTDRYWQSLAEAKTVPVRYVPVEPAVSKLIGGEVENTDLSQSPGLMKGLSLALGGLCLVFLATAAMQWAGWDIDVDTQSGKISIKRFGTGK